MIPDILQYFVSGYIFIFIFNTICSKKIEPLMQLIYSGVISFSWVSLIRVLNLIWIKAAWLDNLWGIVFVSIMLSTISSIAISKIYISDWFHTFSVNSFGISPYDSVWRNVAKSKNGAVLKVFLKDKNYYVIGSLYSYEENGNESWFCMYKIEKCNLNHETIYSQSENDGAYFVFKIKDVDNVEIFV